MNDPIFPSQNLQDSSDSLIMISLDEISGKMLSWVQSGFRKTEYRLFHKDKYLGYLHRDEIGSPIAVAETHNAKWSFRCTRSILPRVTIRSEGLECVGFYEAQRTGNGLYEHCNGQKFIWAPIDSMQTEWGFFREGDKLIAGFIPDFGITKIQAAVKIKPKKRFKYPLDLLIFFGWYLILLESDVISTP